MNPFNSQSNTSNKRTAYKSPWSALVWSVAIPGFGQLYNREFLLGVFLMIWEVVVNLLANLNLSILYSFRGDLQASYDVVNWEWALFYPSVYAYGIWQAFNSSLRTNYEQEIEGEDKHFRPRFTGLFIGMLLGMNFGLYWCFLTSPVFSGLSLGILLAIVGHNTEGLFLKKIEMNDLNE